MRSRSRLSQARQTRRVRAALVAAGLAACALGLGGAAGGVLWIVAGVFTVRSVWGEPPGYAWAVLCLGGAVRWGTMSLPDVETAARLFGPAVAAGAAPVRIGTALALVAAAVSEARDGGLRSSSWALRAAGMGALLAAVAVAVAPGPGRAGVARSLVWWAAVSALAVVVIWVAHPLARRVPAWMPAAAATIGVAAVLFSS